MNNVNVWVVGYNRLETLLNEKMNFSMGILPSDATQNGRSQYDIANGRKTDNE
jgi:hypothetical protein